MCNLVLAKPFPQIDKYHPTPICETTHVWTPNSVRSFCVFVKGLFADALLSFVWCDTNTIRTVCSINANNGRSLTLRLIVFSWEHLDGQFREFAVRSQHGWKNFRQICLQAYFVTKIEMRTGERKSLPKCKVLNVLFTTFNCPAVFFPACCWLERHRKKYLIVKWRIENSNGYLILEWNNWRYFVRCFFQWLCFRQQRNASPNPIDWRNKVLRLKLYYDI